MPGNDSFTKSLLHGDGSNGSTTITDSNIGGSAHTWTPSGNAAVSTAQAKFAQSLAFDGSGDFITADGSSDFAFGTGDFTIDFWARFNSVASSRSLYDSRPSGSNGLYPTITFNAGAVIFYTNSANRISGGSLSINTWYHIALVRSSGTTRLYLDGTQIGSDYTDSNNYLNGASRPCLGASGNSTGSDQYNGYLDELRVSKGVARWTTTFTPPSAAYTPEYSLTQTPVSNVAVAGVSTALKAGRKIAQSVGSVSASGVSVALRAARYLTQSVGAVSTAGQSVTLQLRRYIVAGVKNATVTSYDVLLDRTFVSTYELIAGVKNIAVAGVTTPIRYGRRLAAMVGLVEIDSVGATITASSEFGVLKYTKLTHRTPTIRLRTR